MGSKPKVIYAIQHNKTGRVYIGMTEFLRNRTQTHFDSLKAHNHPNKAMQEDCDKYGFNYTVFVLETDVSTENWWKERYYMETMHTDDPEIGYNGCDPLFRNCKERWRFAEGYPKLNKKGSE